jgi:hypothetical protein
MKGLPTSYSRGPGFRQYVGSETTVLTVMNVLPKSAQSNPAKLRQMRRRPYIVM